MRTMSALRKAAPLPSPIPTAAGSRSAANEIFTEFLDNSLQLPHLSLPHHLPRHPIPEIVDFGSLTGRDSVDRILRSAKQCGAFRINGHGISGEELRSLLREADAESVFRISEGSLNFGNREGIVWDRSNIERLDSAGKFIGTERYRNFRYRFHLFLWAWACLRFLEFFGLKVWYILRPNIDGPAAQICV